MTSLMPHAPRRRPRPVRRPPPLVLPPATSLPASYYEHQPPSKEISSLSETSWTGDARSAAATRRGTRRRCNEDRFFVDESLTVFGVCDGHGGTKAAEKAAQLFPVLMAQHYAFHDAFERTDAEVCALFMGPAFVGTTLTAVEVCRGRYLKVAHVGDSRAMVLDEDGKAVTLTRDHTPNRPDEMRRIEMAGGGVLDGRVNGVLGVSRAVGDTALKSLVISEPEETTYALSANDQLLVVASDGLWDHVSDIDVASYIKSAPLVPKCIGVPANLQAAANGLVDLAVSRGSTDDVSVVLVDLRLLS